MKKFYLNELPQFYSVLVGDMSMVGPRPLSIMHYERDRAQGNGIPSQRGRSSNEGIRGEDAAPTNTASPVGAAPSLRRDSGR